MKFFRKYLTLGLIILFIGTSILPSTVGFKIEMTTSTVSSYRGYIQDLIDNASDGDTIYIQSGIYYENIVIDKSINLIGEKRDNTIIKGKGNESVIYISADWVNISGFTIQTSESYNYSPGIQIQSNFNSITNNWVTNNYIGIIVVSSYGNNINGNDISNNFIGVYLYLYSSSNNIIDNSFINNGLYVYKSYNNKVQNNTVNNKPLVYLEDESDKIIFKGGQVVLLNCNNITVENLNISNTDIGMQILETNSSKIVNNHYSNNLIHINMISSSNNTIIGNNISSSISIGIQLRDSHTNTIIENNILNNYDGILSFWSDFNTIKDNKILNYKGHGVSLVVSNNSIISSNLITSYFNYTSGIYFSSCSKNNISDNQIFKNFYGIELWDSDQNIIIDNNISSNNKYGISLDASSNNIITKNNITQNSWGIFFRYSNSNNIKNNKISNNNYGLFISVHSNYNIILYNNFINNTFSAQDECNNTYDDGVYGNYWSDYEEKYPKARRKPFKGIWNTPYEIELGDNMDNCPLIKQWPKSTSTPIPRTRTTLFTLLNWFLIRFPILERLIELIKAD